MAEWWNRSAERWCYLLSLKAWSLLFCGPHSIVRALRIPLCFYDRIVITLTLLTDLFYSCHYHNKVNRNTSALSTLQLFMCSPEDRNMNSVATRPQVREVTGSTFIMQHGDLKKLCWNRFLVLYKKRKVRKGLKILSGGLFFHPDL